MNNLYTKYLLVAPCESNLQLNERRNATYNDKFYVACQCGKPNSVIDGLLNLIYIWKFIGKWIEI